MMVRILVLLTLAFAAIGAMPQRPARDAARPAVGTASISGTVLVDGERTRPARLVRVTLTDVARTTPGQTTTTDDRGAFTFRDVPAGRFELQAFKAAYLRASYGASRPERAGTPVVVKDGETVTNLTMSIVRGGVITGVVRDVRGRPVPGANVRVLRVAYNGLTGERTLGSPSSGSFAIADDRGEYRAFGLPPGTYFVLVPPPTSGRSNEPIRRLTSADVRRALQAAKSGTASAPGAPPPPTPSLATALVDYAPVFHPGVTDIGAAATITLGLGEERAGIDVTLDLVPTATVSGTITSPSGVLPPMLQVRLVPAGEHTEMLAGAGLRGLTAQLQPDGRFVFRGVAPGTYTIKASVGRGRGAPAPDGPTLWATADVQVSGQDVSVPLALQPGVPINGRVVFEGSQPAPADLQTLSFLLMPWAAGGEIQSFGGGRVDAQGRFTFPSVVPDTYRFATTWAAPTARGTWTIKSSSANGREAFDAPLRVNPGEPVEWVVTFTDTPTTLTGLLAHPDGRAATDYYILVFSANGTHWTPGSRRVRTTRPGTDGRFTVKGLPPGEYFLVSLLDLESGEWNDPAFLGQLVSSAVKVTLRDGETTNQNYRISGQP